VVRWAARVSEGAPLLFLVPAPLPCNALSLLDGERGERRTAQTGDTMDRARPAALRGYAILLGAGASRGASVGSHSPPLDAEFLDVARRLLSRPGKPNADTRAWGNLVKKLRSAGLDAKGIGKWRLEQLSTYLEARTNMPFLQHSAGRPADYSAALAALNQTVCRTLERSNGTRSCSLHKKLFELTQPSCVVSFNYDLIADQSLLDLGLLAWQKPRYGGRSIRIRHSGRDEYTRPRPRAIYGQEETPLLKLHGSINWSAHRKGGGFSLLTRSLPNADLGYPGPPDKPLIVPPVAAKIDIQKGALRDLWKEAARALRQARGWIIWGYSFPETDTVTQVLCRTALAKNRKAKPVVVVNPDSAVAERVSTTLQKVNVRSWPSMERFLFDHDALRL
jgi:hypothetical protein